MFKRKIIPGRSCFKCRLFCEQKEWYISTSSILRIIWYSLKLRFSIHILCYRFLSSLELRLASRSFFKRRCYLPLHLLSIFFFDVLKKRHVRCVITRLKLERTRNRIVPHVRPSVGFRIIRRDKGRTIS